MDLIDFRRVPESAGQTHYFSKDLSSPPLPPSSLSGTCSVAVRWQVDVAYPPREQDFGSRVGVPALSRGMEGTRQGESRSHPYFYCPFQVWFQGVKKVASFLFNPPPPPPPRGWTLLASTIRDILSARKGIFDRKVTEFMGKSGAD